MFCYNVYVYTLLDNEGAVFFRNTSVNVSAMVGQTVALECAPAGEIYIRVTWRPMPSNGHLYNQKYGGVLRIDDVTLSNEGVYNCSYSWASKQDGKTTSGMRQFHLTVKGRELM